MQQRLDRSLVRWFRVSNSSGEEIPAGAVMRITAYSADTDTFTVAKPNANSLLNVLVNDLAKIESDGYGQGTFDGPVYVLFDTADGTPAVGNVWGTENNSWKLNSNKYGFIAVGAGDATLGLVPARPWSSTSASAPTPGTGNTVEVISAASFEACTATASDLSGYVEIGGVQFPVTFTLS